MSKQVHYHRCTHRQQHLSHMAEKSASRTVESHELRHKHFNGKPVYRPLGKETDSSK